MSTAPLRVLVTRAAEQAGDLVARLQVIGCEVVEVPLIEVVEPADDGAQLRAAMAVVARVDSPYDWVVLTSPNAAVRSLSLLTVNAPVRLAAIGPGTAAVCRGLGFAVALVPERSIGEGLVAVFPDAVPGPVRRVLLPRAEKARDVISDGLRSKGWSVDVAVAYRTVDRAPTASEAALASTADVVLCASSSAARSMVKAFGIERLPPRVVSIGPQTTKTLEGLGVMVFATADPHTLDGLVACVQSIVDR